VAYRPLGGRAGRARLQADPLLARLAARHEATPAEIALAWLLSLSPLVLPIPGPSRPQSAASIARAYRIELGEDDRALLDERLPAARRLRRSRERRLPRARTDGEVVLVMGIPGSGKSTLAADLVARGYRRLNRDETGGRLAALLPSLESLADSGCRRVVLDNTYGSRKSRAEVIETAASRGLDVRCVWLDASVEDAQFNAAWRMVTRYGRLLGPEEMRAAARSDPGVFAPTVQFRHRRTLERPEPSEGFSRVEVVPFQRRRDPSFTNRALILWCDGVLRRSRSGKRTPATPDDVEVLAGRHETLARYRRDGWILLALSWQPEVAAGTATPADVDACFERTRDLLGLPLEFLYCPHGGGPPICWCRKPMPGLGVVLIHRHQLDAGQCLYVGDASDRAFARRLGFRYADAAEFF
jgi:predicted kinase/histidinol phosphatase-like enzyme